METRYLIRKEFVIVSPYVGVDSIEKQLLKDSFIVVLDQSEFIGILTPADITKSPHRLVIDCLHNMPRADSEQRIESVLELMIESQNLVLPVFKGEEFIGVVTQHDFTDYLLQYRNELKRAVSERTSELIKTNEQLKQEIEKRKRAEEKTKSYKLVVESAQDAIFFKDLKSRYVIANPKTLEAFGLSEEKVIGKNDYEIMSNKKEAKKNIEDDQLVFKTGKPKEITKHMAEVNGKEYWFQAIKVPQFDNKGNVIGLVGIARDITERKQAEEALRESQEFSFSLLENAAHPLVVINPDTSIRYINPALEKLTGFTKVELVGRKAPYPWWTKDMTKDNTMEQLRSAMVLGVKRLEKCFCKKNGDQFWVEITSVPAKSNEELKYFLVDWVDITERKQAEGVLRKREEALEMQSRHLKEVNTALKVLLDQREADKRDLEENVLSNVKQLVSPYLNRLRKSQLDADQRAIVSTLGSNLDNIVSPFISKLSSKFLDLTPMEIRVADLVKAGRTNKEIAELLCISNNTILSHRFHIRTKLGLKNKGINLRSHLLSLAK